MEPKQCEKCGETVEAARAFCPACGAAMVAEEQRADVSAFDASAGTIQFGKTVYGKVLAEMGLNISEAPNKQPATPPAAAPPMAAPAPATPEKRVGGSNRTKWIVIAIAALLFLGMLAVIVAAAGIYFYSRYQQSTL
jgi:hypothetical protein